MAKNTSPAAALFVHRLATEAAHVHATPSGTNNSSNTTQQQAKQHSKQQPIVRIFSKLNLLSLRNTNAPNVVQIQQQPVGHMGMTGQMHCQLMQQQQQPGTNMMVTMNQQQQHVGDQNVTSPHAAQQHQQNHPHMVQGRKIHGRQMIIQHNRNNVVGQQAHFQQVRQHPYGSPMCPSSSQVAISRGGPVQSPRMIHQLASSTQMMIKPQPSPSQQMQMPGRVSRQVQKQQQQRLMPAPSPSPSMMMTHSQHGSMSEGGGPMTPVTITPRGRGQQQQQPSPMPSPNTAIPMNRTNFKQSTGRNFKGPSKLPKEKTPEKLALPEIIYRPTPSMSMNTTLVAKLVRLVGTERTVKKKRLKKAAAASIQTSNRYSILKKKVFKNIFFCFFIF